MIEQSDKKYSASDSTQADGFLYQIVCPVCNGQRGWYQNFGGTTGTAPPTYIPCNVCGGRGQVMASVRRIEP